MTVTEFAPGLTRAAVEQLSRAKNEPEWMLENRLRAYQIFETLPMPSRTDEAWRRTDISKLRLEEIVPYAEPGAGVQSPLRLNGNNAGLLTQSNSVTVEHTLEPDLAQRGVVMCDLDTAVRSHEELVRTYFMTQAVAPDYDKFTALNAAFWSGGTLLYVPRNVEVEVPLRTLYGLSDGGVGLFTHTLLILEEGARSTFIEEYASPQLTQQSLNAGVVEIIIKSGAHLTFVSLQEWTGNVYDLSTQRAVMERDSRLEWLTIGLGNGLTKSNIETALNGSGASTQMLGILWGYEKQHTDYHTVQDHVAPHTTSDLLYKSALRDEARSIFSGTIRVVKGAMGTDAYQANRSVLLSEHAAAFPSPNLEIEANEVRCTHGASVGKVDQDQLFYLMSRGLPRETAERMVVEGFFEEVLNREPVQSVRDELRDLIRRKMDETD